MGITFIFGSYPHIAGGVDSNARRDSRAYGQQHSLLATLFFAMGYASNVLFHRCLSLLPQKIVAGFNRDFVGRRAYERNGSALRFAFFECSVEKEFEISGNDWRDRLGDDPHQIDDADKHLPGVVFFNFRMAFKLPLELSFQVVAGDFR
ncbi:MAG TPA: hypothetical protein VFV23_07185 [Verrucomicrobiae bacterium]|nr:hypothetical protein [Verrucomicrobiae bacterium]